LVAHALLETGDARALDAVTRGLNWLKPLQVLDVKGDWAEEKPDVRPGGWAFQYRNDHYPDLDDTAVVVMAMDRARERAEHKDGIARGAEWVEGLQSRDGGWGAFDADNSYYYLNNIPFADHGALLDPPTEDVSGRCVGMLAQLGASKDDPRLKAGIAYLLKTQREDGSWWGRWGVNYIYGTWSVLAGLGAIGEDPAQPYIRKAIDWFKRIQNEDGGWGESCNTYDDPMLMGRGVSTPSQTAWALLGLLAVGEVESPQVKAGVDYLLRMQNDEGEWTEDEYTGTGFARVFYLRYHGYSRFFPLWALGTYTRLRRGLPTRQQEVMAEGAIDLGPLPVLEDF
jgi:squalene-hopene/tetraprenyl-beta-curcumene cyclase